MYFGNVKKHPRSPGMMRFACPHCGRRISVPTGKQPYCWRCKRSIDTEIAIAIVLRNHMQVERSRVDLPPSHTVIQNEGKRKFFKCAICGRKLKLRSIKKMIDENLDVLRQDGSIVRACSPRCKRQHAIQHARESFKSLTDRKDWFRNQQVEMRRSRNASRWRREMADFENVALSKIMEHDNE